MTKIGIDRYNFHDNSLDLEEEEEEARKADQAEETTLKQQKKIPITEFRNSTKIMKYRREFIDDSTFRRT